LGKHRNRSSGIRTAQKAAVEVMQSVQCIDQGRPRLTTFLRLAGFSLAAVQSEPNGSEKIGIAAAYRNVR
jgi:hypothetical protein